MFKKSLLLAVFSLLSSFVEGQDVKPPVKEEIKQDQPDITWGKVSPEDFNLSKYKVDTSLGAVIMADVGSSFFKGNTKGSFSLVFKRQTRIKITNKKGLDMANVKVLLYHSDKSRGSEILENVKASTYNLENGQVLETKLDKKDLFTVPEDKFFTMKKFALGNVKEGSILEYSYSIVSDFAFNLQPWSFQSEYPELWSEYSVDIPSFYEYVFLSQGYHPLYFRKTSTHPFTYRVLEFANNIKSNNEPESYQVGSVNTLNRWVMKDLPAIREEKFITSLNNYKSKIEFQFSAYNFKGQAYDPQLQTWPQVASELMDVDDNFGLDLKRETAFLNEGLRTAKNNTDNDLDLAKGIYSYIRDHIKWNGDHQVYLSKTLRQSFQNKEGNIADVNMLLVAMLLQGKLDAHPFILSTRSHGLTNPYYPILAKYNYVLAQVNIDGKSFLLDASRPYLGFGQLPAEVYNGGGELITKTPISINLSPDSILQSDFASVNLSYDEKNPLVWKGQYNQQYSLFSSFQSRAYIRDKGLETYKKNLKEEYQNSLIGSWTIDSLQVVNPNDLEHPLKESFYFKVKSSPESGLIYMVPSLNLKSPNNPFKSAIRTYPVEFNNRIDDIYTIQIDVPNGYKIDEIPKSVRVNLNDKDGSFEYTIGVEDNVISLKTHLKINKTTFLPEDYSSIRDFYNYIYKKTAEPIVFKKL